MATLKERLHGELQEMIAERTSLDDQIKQMRGVIQGLDGNGAAPKRASRRATTKRRTKRAPVVPAADRQRQVLEFMGKEKKPVTSKQVADALGVTPNVARKHIDSLIKSKGVKDAGIQARDPNARGGRESKLYALA